MDIHNIARCDGTAGGSMIEYSRRSMVTRYEVKHSKLFVAEFWVDVETT